MFLIILSNNEALLPIIFILTVISIIGFIAYYFNPKRVILRKLSKIPNKPLGGLKTNVLSKITGKALHVKEPLIAPLSKRKCIFYSITIKQRKSTGKSSHWKTILKEEKIQDFFIDNNGDYVIIKPTQKPKNFISYLVKDKSATSGTFNEPTPEFESLLKRYNIDSKSFFGFNKPLRYSEGIIEIGEMITVAGIAKWKTLSERIPEYQYSKIATLESENKQKLIITDLPMVNATHRR
jgi:hypothetical protein